MKTAITSIVSLLIGLAVGTFAGYRYYEGHITNEAVRMAVEGGESSDMHFAAVSAKAVDLMDSGEHQKAVEMLARPIANYYCSYAMSTVTNERRLKMRSMIDDLASKNQTVAAHIEAKKLRSGQTE
jgi:hypothetical protein